MVAPPGRFTMGELVDSSINAAKALATPSSPPRAVWVSLAFLEQQKADGDFPIWVPPTGDTAGFANVSATRAVRAGLKLTPIGATVRDTLAWYLGQSRSAPAHLKAGPTAGREAELLAAWRASSTRMSARPPPV